MFVLMIEIPSQASSHRLTIMCLFTSVLYSDLMQSIRVWESCNSDSAISGIEMFIILFLSRQVVYRHISVYVDCTCDCTVSVCVLCDWQCVNHECDGQSDSEIVRYTISQIHKI